VKPVIRASRRLALCLLLAAWAPAFPSRGQGVDADPLREASRGFVAVAKALTPSVVNVKQFKRATGPSLTTGDPYLDQLRRFFGPGFGGGASPRQGAKPGELVQTGLGSGVIVRADGIVLTNNHVVFGADALRVTLSDRREVEAELVGTDPRTDIAVLRLPRGSYPAAPLGDSDRIEVGEWAIAIGNPFGLSQSVTTGVISAKGRADVGISELEDFIQTDAAINPGNSGGPLIDIEGRVVGINTAIFSQSGGYQGVGFAVPINMARAVMDGLLTAGRIVRPDLGVRAEAAQARKEGVEVTDLLPGGGAKAAGIRKGDVILKVGGRDTPDLETFYRAVSSLTVGKEVEVTVARGAGTRALPVRVGDLPGRPSESPQTLRTALGFSVQELTGEYADQLGFRYERGVLVIRVERLSPADRAGVEPGDLVTAVNGRPTPDLAVFRKEFERVDWGGKATLSLRRGEKSLSPTMVLPPRR